METLAWASFLRIHRAHRMGHLIAWNMRLCHRLLSSTIKSEYFRSPKKSSDRRIRPLKVYDNIVDRPSKPYGSDVKEKAFGGLYAKEVLPEPEDRFGQIGEEIAGKKLDKIGMNKILLKFYQLPSIRQALKEIHDIDEQLFYKAWMSFKQYCIKSASLPPELHIRFIDILDDHCDASDLLPFFLTHARQAFPHLECQKELKKISDLKDPPNWYPEARGMIRKIYFHSGPTNSGKTYNALQRFFESESGVYCGPLKLLAHEVYQKSNNFGTPCDLVTGEERKFANPDGYTRSKHTSCTVEMVQTHEPVDVAVIDEIQMMRDPQRGWAWTRALLGIPAKELHLCGEEAALHCISEIIEGMGEDLQIQRYERLTPLVVENQPLCSLDNVQDGDCIVCFNKEDLYSVCTGLERKGLKFAVIYGSLPPQTKLRQCERFNDPSNKCKILVATDAIGMGLNLSIRRVIFHSLIKVGMDIKDKVIKKELISVSQALQIAGRAGRFRTQYEKGFVTTFKPEDLSTLTDLLKNTPDQIDRAGLHPTSDQIELFSFYLPHLSLSDLIELFIDICQFDTSNYFICDMEQFKLLAEHIQHIQIPLKARYLFCCAPINNKSTFAVAMFVRFVRQFSSSEPVTLEWLCQQLQWPVDTPKNVMELAHLEQVFDVLDLYLWLGCRFPDMFPDSVPVRSLQTTLDTIINQGVNNIVNLNKTSVDNSNTSVATSPRTVRRRK